ncbi:MAG: hypothetical protein JJU29_08495 [Verrucomicrobia bacterium]|nr:hypothetical protein [Verrucomicrobiota bacterium]MCH8512967.1 hypothetical protein [Kiritimatiellia bacterium]
MTDTKTKSDDKNDQFTEDDIFFECPHCGKSMAIDKRGMGLTIECPDCSGLVRVPTVSNEKVDSPDSVNMPTEALAEALEESRKQIDELTAQVTKLTQRRDALEKTAASQKSRIEELRHEFANIQTALDQISLIMVNGNDAG